MTRTSNQKLDFETLTVLRGKRARTSSPSIWRAPSLFMGLVAFLLAPVGSVQAEDNSALAARALELTDESRSETRGLFQRIMTQDYCGTRSTGAGLLTTRDQSYDCSAAEREELLRALAVAYQTDVESQTLLAQKTRQELAAQTNERTNLEQQLIDLRATLVRQQQAFSTERAEAQAEAVAEREALADTAARQAEQISQLQAALLAAQTVQQDQRNEFLAQTQADSSERQRLLEQAEQERERLLSDREALRVQLAEARRQLDVDRAVFASEAARNSAKLTSLVTRYRSLESAYLHLSDQLNQSATLVANRFPSPRLLD